MPFNSKYYFTPNLLHFLSLKNSLSAFPPPRLLLSTHNKNHPLTSPLSLSQSVPAMDSQSPCRLVLCGKSSAEKELAKSIKDSKALKLPDNAQLEIVLHSDTETPVEENCFRHDSFLSSLSTTRFGRFLIWSPRLPSTHDVVSHNFCELPVGTVCVADVQFKGRGRSQNMWESPRGCLMFSFTIQMEDGRVVPLVQYVVCLAMTEAINDVCHKNGIPYLHVRIKWPNDLYLNGLKVGGILCTSTYRSKKFNVSAGIGLNIDNEQPTTCLNAVLQKLTSISYQLQREDILAAFFNKFEDLFDLFIDKGFQPLEQLYYQAWLHSGQRVIVQEKDDNQLVENVVTVQGLTSSGYLLAVGEGGQMCELHPDGNSFDFFKGLVRRKLT
ncbi:biotin--protein ligase 2 [Rhododendron vialii]|uniref:biotin--protein ligase 2 n=1 Tax=Rhododendron vialii TaxID=182163 RepID=UPI00265E4630|nr:biotin--protein ligase 2 [Rhododendron vialii]